MINILKSKLMCLLVCEFQEKNISTKNKKCIIYSFIKVLYNLNTILIINNSILLEKLFNIRRSMWAGKTLINIIYTLYITKKNYVCYIFYVFDSKSSLDRAVILLAPKITQPKIIYMIFTDFTHRN